MDALMKELIENMEMKKEILLSGYEFNISYDVSGKIYIFLHSCIGEDTVELSGSFKTENESLNKMLDIICGLQAFGGYK